MLALAAVTALSLKHSGAIALVLAFNIVGTLDLANALRTQEVGFGAVWFIPTILVPLLLVTHVMMLFRLSRGVGAAGWFAIAARPPGWVSTKPRSVNALKLSGVQGASERRSSP